MTVSSSSHPVKNHLSISRLVLPDSSHEWQIPVTKIMGMHQSAGIPHHASASHQSNRARTCNQSTRYTSLDACEREAEPVNRHAIFTCSLYS